VQHLLGTIGHVFEQHFWALEKVCVGLEAFWLTLMDYWDVMVVTLRSWTTCQVDVLIITYECTHRQVSDLIAAIRQQESHTDISARGSNRKGYAHRFCYTLMTNPATSALAVHLRLGPGRAVPADGRDV
jgi:hypothetical protein